MDYYINLKNANNKAAIWKYTSSSSSLSWIDLPSIQKYSIGILMLNDNQLLFMGQDTSTLTLLHIYKITFSTKTYNWGSHISCSSNCSPSYAESIQNSDSSKIYSLFLLESSSYAYFITLNATDGSAVDSRYKSSISWGYVLGSVRKEDILVFCANWDPSCALFVYDTNSLKLSVNFWKGCISGMATEASTNR